MTLAYEGNTDLAFDTGVFRRCAKKYGKIADDLRSMASDLDDCLTELKESGWTTDAGSAFQKMADTNWETNIKKYANLLDTLEKILNQAAKEYEELEDDYIERTKL